MEGTDNLEAQIVDGSSNEIYIETMITQMFSILLHLIHHFLDIKFVTKVCTHFSNTITNTKLH
jgi:hypothetical protein